MKLRDKDLVMVKGKVYYLDKSPVKNAVVIIEKIIDEETAEFIDYTITNKEGEYLFLINNKEFSYKISAFEGILNSLI